MKSHPALRESRPGITHPAGALAAGLAQTLAALAREQGAPASSCTVVAATAVLLVDALEAGHVCLPLDRLEADLAAETGPEQRATPLLTTLLESGMAGTGGQARPIVIDAGQVYLYRYHDYECRLAAAVERLARAPTLPIDLTVARSQLTALFAGNTKHLAPGEVDDQKVAAAVALLQPMTIISGGPGTGKTTTVAAILACLLATQPNLRVQLAAPTGKAAARMLDALRERASTLAPELSARLPAEAHTIHRLLRPLPGSNRFRHDARHPLAVDVLVVDEASMLDLALATRLLEALPSHARLILLGDKDQLAAVEAGAVFHALAAHSGIPETLRDTVAALCEVPPAVLPRTQNPDAVGTTIWLRRTFRFAQGGPIGRLANFLRDGVPDEGRQTLTRQLSEADGLDFVPVSTPTLPPAVVQVIGDELTSYVALLQQSRPTEEKAAALLTALDQHRVLCAVRKGERGVEQLNELITRLVQERLRQVNRRGDAWFAGRPVMLLENDYTLGLYNGDIGVTLAEPGGPMLVWFPSGHGGLRSVAAARLPRHETAFACTVHKAQGSQYARITLILPVHDTPVLTRELIYTGITRASERLRIVGDPDLLEQAVQRSTLRHSGLAQRLGKGRTKFTKSLT